jgi:8-oxo-dGTP diphosphatase
MLDVLAWVCVRDRRMLAVRSRGRDAWYMPGGKREPGESDAQGLAREVAEELCVILNGATLREYCVVRDLAHGKNIEMQMAFCMADALGEPEPHAEIDALAWLTSAGAAHCASAARQVLMRLHADGLID